MAVPEAAKPRGCRNGSADVAAGTSPRPLDGPYLTSPAGAAAKAALRRHFGPETIKMLPPGISEIMRHDPQAF